jgi:ADP-L-glycero-D-manno-heptose 6-epimerase
LNTNSTILITGAAGFIGSCMAGYLNTLGYKNLILVDDFGAEEKRPNWEAKEYTDIVERYNLFNWLEANNDRTVDYIIHLGARTDTTEFDYAIHQELNVDYSKNIWQWCAKNNVPLIYASSAATYGSGELGYNDNHDIIEQLQPLNPYGVSKNEFDKWVLQQISSLPIQGSGALPIRGSEAPPIWIGLKFFNVYGPNEYHKGRMASVIFHSYNQIKKSGLVKLFKSHRPDFEDGQQLRDFIYVMDVVKVIEWLMHQPADINGIYNLGTGKARSFYHLAVSTFAGVNKQPNIEFIDMPEDIRDKYQYFTEANMDKLKSIGYTNDFYSLEEGVTDYVKNYLVGKKYY